MPSSPLLVRFFGDVHQQEERLVLGAFSDTVPRETREVASASGLDVVVARRVLLRLEVAGKVVHLKGTLPGRPWRWRRVASPPDTA